MTSSLRKNREELSPSSLGAFNSYPKEVIRINNRPCNKNDLGYHMPYVKTLDNVLTKTANEYKRFLVIRLDLRVPIDYPYDQINFNKKLITRFINKLNWQINNCLKKRLQRGLRVHHTRLRYVWVKEQVNSEHPHWHLVITLNQNTFRSLGDWGSNTGVTLSQLIIRAWALALKDDTLGLVEFPKKGVFYMDSDHPEHEARLNIIRERLKYLAKKYSKNIHADERSIGSSFY